jgi:hypothetical protein
MVSVGWSHARGGVEWRGSLLSACGLSSNGHRRDTTDRLAVTRIQSRWEVREGT